MIAHNVCSLGLNLALTSALRAIAGRSGGPRLILWHHDLGWALPSYRATLHPGLPWDLLREAWPGATQVVVSTARQAELAALTGLAPEEIRVVPNGVDVADTLRLGRADAGPGRAVAHPRGLAAPADAGADHAPQERGAGAARRGRAACGGPPRGARGHRARSIRTAPAATPTWTASAGSGPGSGLDGCAWFLAEGGAPPDVCRRERPLPARGPPLPAEPRRGFRPADP